MFTLIALPAKPDVNRPSKKTPLPRAQPRARIVSSAHLVSPRSEQASEFEFGLIVGWNAFSRWLVRCMAAAGAPDFTAIDVLLLHHVTHRARNKKLADICFVLNVEDTHIVAYALKKLVAAGWVDAEKNGKEVLYRASDAGAALVERYRAVREQCLIDSLDASLNDPLGETARTLRTMSGFYDQAARAASSF